jgi:hypothetical protein
MIGDFSRNYGYPYIDIANGGSLRGMLDGLDATMELAGPDTKLVPGHGTIIKREDIVPYRDMIFAVREKVQQMIAQGKTLQDVLAAKVTAPFDAKVPRRAPASRCRDECRPVRRRGVSGTQERRLRRVVQGNKADCTTRREPASKLFFTLTAQASRFALYRDVDVSKPLRTHGSRSTRWMTFSTLAHFAGHTAADAPGPDRSIAW